MTRKLVISSAFCLYSPDSGSHDNQNGSHGLQGGLYDSSNEEEETLEVTDDYHDNQWDCESVLSTYSNLYNHPVTISEQVRVWCVVVKMCLVIVYKLKG